MPKTATPSSHSSRTLHPDRSPAPSVRALRNIEAFSRSLEVMVLSKGQKTLVHRN
jgi:hypothetical protein